MFPLGEKIIFIFIFLIKWVSSASCSSLPFAETWEKRQEKRQIVKKMVFLDINEPMCSQNIVSGSYYRE